MALTITVNGKSDNTWYEVGTKLTLAATGGTSNITWSVETGEGTIVLASKSGASITATTMGFGTTTIKATDSANATGLITLYIGSVVLAGADGSYYLIKPNGANAVNSWYLNPPGGEEPAVSTAVVSLKDANAIVADLTQASSQSSVTCYVLNLASFHYQPPQ